MIIKFPTEIENLSPQEAKFFYEDLIHHYRLFRGMQTRWTDNYSMIAVCFLISCFGTLILSEKIGLNLLLTVCFFGLGSLLLFFFTAIPDLSLTMRAGLCVEKGLEIEGKFADFGNLFKTVKKTRINTFIADMWVKALLLGFVFFITLIAGSIMLGKDGILLTTVVAFIFSISIIGFAMLYMRLAKRAIFGIIRQA